MSVESRRGGAQRGHERPRRSPRADGGDGGDHPGEGGDRVRPAQGGRSGSGSASHPATDRIARLVEPVVAEAGFDLEQVAVTPAGRRRLVRVVVDCDGGVSLDDIALVSRAVSDALDESDVMGAAPYVLEVTSPGVDRPLTEPRHWRRAAGRLVRVALSTGGDIEGRVLSADDEAVVMEVDGERRRLELGILGRGRVQVEFRRPGESETDPEAETDEDEAGTDSAADLNHDAASDVEPDED